MFKPGNKLDLCFLFFQDSDIQKKIDYEIRMREGACKLLAACSQRDQALEASKSLLTCNVRIMAYMSELQHMKEAQVMQRVARRSVATFDAFSSVCVNLTKSGETKLDFWESLMFLVLYKR